jgi:hypothetical protein
VVHETDIKQPYALLEVSLVKEKVKKKEEKTTKKKNRKKYLSLHF